MHSGSRTTLFASLSAIVFALLVFSTHGHAARHVPQFLAIKHGAPVIYEQVGRATGAPMGWLDFCRRYKSECTTRKEAARDIVLTEKSWKDLTEINSWVNSTIKPETDLDHWGTVERWSLAEDGYGDCEDYALLKRHLLMQAGWPMEALLIDVVRDPKGEGHAVLTAKTDLGEYILDNLEAEVLIWYRTVYKFVKRQSQSDQNVWVALEGPRTTASLGAIHHMSGPSAKPKASRILLEVADVMLLGVLELAGR